MMLRPCPYYPDSIGMLKSGFVAKNRTLAFEKTPNYERFFTRPRA